MFDEVVRSAGGERATRRASWVGVSIFAQVLLAIGVVAFYRARAVTPGPGPVVEVTFVRRPPALAAPPPLAPPGAQRQKPPRQPSPRPPAPVPALLQPKEVPPEARPSDPDQAHAPDDPSWDDGVVGGMPGGATDGAALPAEPREFDAATMSRPVFVSGPDLAYTRRAFEHEVEGLMIVKCLITAEGAVRDCRIAKGLPYMDETVVQLLERRRYRPATLDGRPVEVRYVFRINLRLPR
ncbi:MAG TPA: energy transducer TonB [Anaeromyxobacteraceae bacterium]|nr:energy transducer TonB [Anaeromyxobacteraceae bacterium]